jgi:hypothetical protein
VRASSLGLLLGIVASACSEAPVDEQSTGGTRGLADYTLSDGFFAAPFPDDARRGEDGRPVVAGFPNPTASSFLDKLIALLERDATGFSTTAGIFLAFDGPLAATLDADHAASLESDAPVFLIDIDAASPEHGKRKPVRVHFAEDAGPFGAPNLLSLVPLQGIPLREDTRYAAVVMRHARDSSGALLAAARKPEGMTASLFEERRAALAAVEIAADQVASFAVFTTGTPGAQLLAVRNAMLAAPLPAPLTPFAPAELFERFCVFESTIEMPIFQSGTPPFTELGGAWESSPDAAPILQGHETARIVVTIPRSTMPAPGFPVVLFSRTGGGGDRPLVDRGARADSGGPAILPGSGPALELARAGFAGVSVDGPHGGLRNVTSGDEQFLIFNVTNPAALRDNVRQSAAELALQAHVLGALSIDASSCPGLESGGAPVKLDTNTLALMGHSMGATIAPLTLAVEPMFSAVILSGAGGSWIENVLHKQKPLAVKGFAELLLGVAGKHSLSASDPALSLFQWGTEPSDPPVYGRAIVAEPLDGAPRHVLMLQGIVDHYILPPIANATSLSLGLDLAGDALDSATPELADLPSLGSMLAFSGRAQIGLPASGNASGATALVVQHREDGIEDGHEVVFQTEMPKRQYRCFLESLLTGAPRVPTASGDPASCD